MDALGAIARTSGGVAGGFNVCFPAVPAVETPKEPPWHALTPEEWAQQLLGSFGQTGCVGAVLYPVLLCRVKVNHKFAVLSLLWNLERSASLCPQVTALSSFRLLLINL